MSKQQSASFSGGAGPSASAVGAVVANHDELVVLQALGKRNRMAKSISLLPNGEYAVTPHDGRKVYLVAHARTVKLKNVLDVARALCSVASDEFIIRGSLVPGLPPRFRRLLHAKPTAPATLVETPRSYIILDIDGASSALSWYNPRTSDEETTDWAVEALISDLLPAAFHGVSCFFSCTGGHGVKPGMNLRLAFWLERPMTSEELKAWLGYLRHRGVDQAVFSAAQQVLVAPPILALGLSDPVQVRRGMIWCRRSVVIPPSMSAIAAVARTRKAPAGTPASAGKRPARRRKPGGGYCEALRRIGDGPDQEGVHGAIMSAIGAWARAAGPDSDGAALISDITGQLATTVVDPAKHSATYIADQVAALPKMVAEVCEMERHRRTSEAAAQHGRMRTPVTADRALVTATADEAAQQVAEAVHKFIRAVPGQMRRRKMVWGLCHQNDFGHTYPAPVEPATWRTRGALTVDVGVGKTEQVIKEVVTLIAARPETRIAYVVPEHKLAGDVRSRINGAAGSEIAAVWRGISQPDPGEPDFAMCRRSEDADLVRRAGGELGNLCGSKSRGYCPFHPEGGGKCAYVPQRGMTPSVWIIPAAMLTSAVPEPMQRGAVEFYIGGKSYKATPPAFDLLVLDEAPFLNWLGGFDGTGMHVALSWLDTGALRMPPGQNQEEHDAEIEKALLALRDMAVALYVGEVALRDHYAPLRAREVGDEDPSFGHAADLLSHVLGKAHVSPGDTGDKLAGQLHSRLEAMERIRAVQRLLRIHADIIDGRAALACLAPSEMPDGTKAIRLRWRERIRATWLDCPVLYLDGTAKIPLAEQWLGKVDELVTAQAAAPHMRVVQVDDRAFGYGSVISGSDPATARTAAGHQRRIADLMTVARAGTGGAGLLVGPKEMVKQMTAAGMVSSGWETATFGSLRGVDRFKTASVGVVASRQLPTPADIELMAEVVFGRDVKHLDSDWYPTTAAIRLMADGTGRETLVECHPDPDVETVRWTLCEAEVLQGIGRLRGVRRDADHPVLVFVLNQLDLGHLAISELQTWDDLSAACGPTMLMAARGCVPKMWSDIAHMVGRWDDAKDPAGNAKTWFRDNPAEKALLEELFVTNRITHPLSGIEMNFRRESIGLIGKNHRYVWLAECVTQDNARTVLA